MMCIENENGNISDMKMSGPEMFKGDSEARECMEKMGYDRLFKIGTYHFGATPNEKSLAHMICNYPNNYYEYLWVDEPQRMFADLDGKFEFDGYYEREVISTFNEVVKFCVEKYLGEEYDVSSTRWLRNHRDEKRINGVKKYNKFSVHFNYLPKTFKNSTTQKTFWGAVKDEVNKKEKWYKLLSCPKEDVNGKVTTPLIIDDAVYSKKRAMRTIYSRKAEGEQPLLPYQWLQVGDTLGYFETEPLNVKQENIPEYFHHMPNSKTHFKLTYKPRKDNTSNTSRNVYFNRQELEETLERDYPDMRILGPNPYGYCITRKKGHNSFKCICGDNHHKNNASLILKRNGEVDFKCYITKETKPFIELEIRNNDKDYFWDDYTELSKIENITEQELVKFCNDAFQFMKLGVKPTWRVRVKDHKGEIKYTEIVTDNFTLLSKFYLKYTIKKSDENSLMDIIWHLINYNKIKTYTSTVYIPYCKVKPIIEPRFINSFKPFFYSTYKAKKIIDFETTNIYSHFKNVICDNDENVIKYFKQYWGDKIQNPHITSNKRGVVIVLKGKQGDGKDLWMNMLVKLLDEDNCVEETTGNGLFQPFNGIYKNKLLVSISETNESSDFRKNSEKFKGMVTARTIPYNSKGCPIQILEHRTTYNITTNKDNAIECGRRAMYQQVNQCRNGDTVYFNLLGKELEDDDIMKSFFDYLHNVDISDYACGNFPKTKLLKETQEQQLSSVIKFLIQYCQEEIEQPIIDNVSYPDVRSHYSNYCKRNNMHVKSENVMGSELKKIGIDKKRRTVNGERIGVLLINKEQLTSEIKKVHKIDVDLNYI